MQKFFKSEVGRSMVEMLGILAIIGVLSIGAVAGYSYGVTKWKANETIADLHVRALEYTRQMAMQKKFTPDFAFNNFDLGDENSLGNPVAGYPLFDDPDFFEIEVRGVSAEVCRQIIRDVELPILDVAVNNGNYGANENQCGVEIPVNLVTMTFLFSKTLEDAGDPLEAPAVVTQARPDDCPASRWANIEGVCCAEDEIGTGGHCCPLTSTGWGQNMGRCCITDEIYSNGNCCPSGEKWNSAAGHCVSEGTGQCLSNDQCLTNEYCHYISATYNKATAGICKPAVVSHTKTVDGITYKSSDNTMYWFSAANFCERVGGSVIHISDFGCGYDIVGTKTTWGWCNEDNNNDRNSPRSKKIKKLRQEFPGKDNFWTDDQYDAAYHYSMSMAWHYAAYASRLHLFYTLCRMP